MSWGDGICPWPYESSYVEHMPTCTFGPPSGLGDDLTADEWGALESGPGITPPTYTAPSSWNRNLGVPVLGLTGYQTTGGKTAYLSPGNPLIPATDYTWLIYAGIGLAVVMMLSKGRR